MSQIHALLVGLTAALLAAAAGLVLAGCARTPRGSYVDRVRTVCGPEIARDYASVKWRDRDYAQDSLLVSCIVFKDRTP
jgi:hypothetical protein